MSIGCEEFRRRYTWLKCAGHSVAEGGSLGLGYQDQAEWNAQAGFTGQACAGGRPTLIVASAPQRYAYNFSWLGRPVIQYPQDIVAMQELIWRVQPDLIIETGIAHGGSLIFSASMLELNAACGGPKDARVLGVDIDIRPHNRKAIEEHPMFRRIDMIQGSSIAPEIVAQVHARAAGRQRVMVCLDSNHTHDHALAELKAYASLTSVGSYCVVFDTVVEDLPAPLSGAPLGPGQQPEDGRLGISGEGRTLRDRRAGSNEAAHHCGPRRLSPTSSLGGVCAGARRERTSVTSDTPLVSVIVPVRNGAATLQLALDGLIGQTHKNISRSSSQITLRPTPPRRSAQRQPYETTEFAMSGKLNQRRLQKISASG